jgi:PhnB protein
VAKSQTSTVPTIHEVFIYLCVNDGAAAIDFYSGVFGARESFRMAEPDGRIGHAELKLGPVTLMLADEHPEVGFRSPLRYGGTGTIIHLHVDDVDALANHALAAGATMLSEPRDEAHGERQCRIRDPFGHEWLLGHVIATGGVAGEREPA